MSLSSNSIIHLTDDFSYLKGILTSNFKVSYCKESIAAKDKTVHFFAPMVSFCDIPMSNIKDHISKYGNYGIGLTKEWAERKGLNPVLYLEKESTLSYSLYSLAKESLNNKKAPQWDLQQQYMAEILRFTKNYQNDLDRKGNIFKDYRFSDEREWRYCPSYSDENYMLAGGGSSKSALNKKIDLELSFEAKDIKYLIVENESDIIPLIELLRNKKGNSYSYHDVEILATRIITSTQINSDF